MNYLASPPLVVAYALAGTMDTDLSADPLGTDTEGRPVYLKDLWPSESEVADTIRASLSSEEYRARYASVYEGDARWQGMEVSGGETFGWDADSTYVLQPPYFEGMGMHPEPVADIEGARVLALLGDSVTTDHISPAGSIRPTSPAGRYLADHGVEREDFNSYGARRGNHEIMIRGTFANVRLRNQLVPGTEGGVTVHLPEGEETTIFEAAERYRAEGVPLLVLAGKEYGSGSSRDWAAKGTRLLGVRAVIAESYERIHRSNLVGMGVLPLQFPEGQSAAGLGLSGRERFDIAGLSVLDQGTVPSELTVRAVGDDGAVTEFSARVRIDTPMEAEYYRHGGILPFVLRQLAGTSAG
jgi:aconitate hydratase